MQFFNRRAIASYFLILFLVVLMTSCGGGGSSSADKKAAATVTEVDIFPNPSISLTPGQVTRVFAQALNSSGNQVFTQTITFSSSNPAIQITANAARPPNFHPTIEQAAVTGTNSSNVCWIGNNTSKKGRNGQTRKAASPQRSGRHD